MLIVGHEANNVTLPLLRDGGMDFVIASPQKVLLDEALRRATSPAEAPQPDQTLVDFGVYTRFNLPSFSGAA